VKKSGCKNGKAYCQWVMSFCQIHLPGLKEVRTGTSGPVRKLEKFDIFSWENYWLLYLTILSRPRRQQKRSIHFVVHIHHLCVILALKLRNGKSQGRFPWENSLNFILNKIVSERALNKDISTSEVCRLYCNAAVAKKNYCYLAKTHTLCLFSVTWQHSGFCNFQPGTSHHWKVLVYSRLLVYEQEMEFCVVL